jgi:hypothetical protein
MARTARKQPQQRLRGQKIEWRVDGVAVVRGRSQLMQRQQCLGQPILPLLPCSLLCCRSAYRYWGCVGRGSKAGVHGLSYTMMRLLSGWSERETATGLRRETDVVLEPVGWG